MPPSYVPHRRPWAGLGLAFICGVLANRLRLSPLVGYLLAGVLIGPSTPGFVADQTLDKPERNSGSRPGPRSTSAKRNDVSIGGDRSYRGRESRGQVLKPVRL